MPAKDERQATDRKNQDDKPALIIYYLPLPCKIIKINFSNAFQGKKLSKTEKLLKRKISCLKPKI